MSSKQGRPPASHAYPKLWKHLDQLGYAGAPGAVALKKLRNENNIPLPFKSRLSNRFLETKCQREYPCLLDYKTAHDLVTLVGVHLQRNSLGSISPAAEIVRFDSRIVGLERMMTGRITEHGDALEELSSGADLTSDAIRSAIGGRLLPHAVCLKLQAAAAARGVATDIVAIQPGRKGAPVSDPLVIRSVLGFLAA